MEPSPLDDITDALVEAINAHYTRSELANYIHEQELVIADLSKLKRSLALQFHPDKYNLSRETKAAYSHANSCIDNEIKWLEKQAWDSANPGQVYDETREKEKEAELERKRDAERERDRREKEAEREREADREWEEEEAKRSREPGNQEGVRTHGGCLVR